jgi:hypothetical protein
MNNRLQNRVISFEILEGRQMLDGAITGVVQANTGKTNENELVLTGDFRNNAVAVWSGTNPGEYFVAGGNDSVGRNTTVNGQTGAVTFTGVQTIRLDLGGGNDKVLITNLQLPEPPGYANSRLRIGGAAGNDQAIIAATGPRNFMLNNAAPIPYGPVNVPFITMNGNLGNDTLTLSKVQAGFVSFEGDEGSDVFQIDGSQNLNQFDKLKIYMGKDTDKVAIKRATIGEMKISDANGGAPAAPFTLDLSQLNIDRDVDVGFGNCTLANVNIDRVIADLISVQGSAQTYNVNIDNVTVRHLFVGSSVPPDSNNVTIRNSTFENLYVELGSGDDTFTLQNTTVTTITSFDGGDGTDTYQNLSGNSLANPTIINFE